MKIAVFSDSHGDREAMRLWIDALSPDRVLYLGDGIGDIPPLKKEYPSIQFSCVKGNCDHTSDAAREATVDADGFRFLLTHGDKYCLYNRERSDHEYLSQSILDRARACNAALALHGHTHIATLWTEGDVTVMNPGSVQRQPGRGYSSCGWIETNERHFVCKILFEGYYI